MSRVVRAFLVWAMVIAVPVQGMAASAMLFCGTGHQRMMQGPGVDASAAVSGHDGHAAHHAATTDHGVHEHPVSGGPVVSESSAGSDADGGQGLSPHHGKFGCSACAACFSMLALPASFALPEAASLAQPVRMSPDAAIASHQPDGLDRPPRTANA